MNKETEKVLNESFEKMNESFEKMNEVFDRAKHFDEMSDAIYDALDKDFERSMNNIKIITVRKNSWKNTVIERIMYFLLGGLIGLLINYYIGG